MQITSQYSFAYFVNDVLTYHLWSEKSPRGRFR